MSAYEVPTPGVGHNGDNAPASFKAKVVIGLLIVGTAYALVQALTALKGAPVSWTMGLM